jgi:protein-S-isoprenylcysteine O-methyltransferase Ste14
LTALKDEMFYFFIPLLVGFGFNLASAFTSFYSQRWGKRRGQLVTIIFRDVLGIPVWVLGLGLAMRAPSPALFASTSVTQISGWLLLLIGGLIILAALFTIRLRAAAPTNQDKLVKIGLYASVRHPIHTGTFFEFVGLFLIAPSQSMAAACMIGCIWILIQTRLEEVDLLQRMPEYRQYMQSVPRFWPRLRRKAAKPTRQE